jgi:hypothetical protein
MPAMRRLLALALALALASAAAALDLGAERPTRPDVTHPQNVPSDDRIRQGGDTILDAFEVTLPFLDDGTTAGYTDDYDEACPYDGSTSPDVVYTFTPEVAMGVTVDLFGSAYDTKVYIYDEDAALVACNDDFYSDWTSKLENVAVESGVQYFVIVDGYGGDAGEYQIGIEEHEPCELWWPEYVELEGEPPLVDGYVDEYNGGCYAGGSVPFQAITHWAFRGVSGWYVFEDGVSRRDTDWFEIQIPPGGHVSIAGDAEQPTFMFELGPQDCANVDVLQSVSIGPCSEGTMDILGYPGDIVWFWVGPQTYEAPDGFEGNEYAYRLFLTPPYVAVEDHSLTDVKALFR